jgi:hypothetical protein
MMRDANVSPRSREETHGKPATIGRATDEI